MVKTMLRAAAASPRSRLSAPTFAQQPVATQPRVGLGVSMNTSLIGPLLTVGSSPFAPPTSLYVPFYVAPNFRIEPQIGWLKVNDDFGRHVRLVVRARHRRAVREAGRARGRTSTAACGSPRPG